MTATRQIGREVAWQRQVYKTAADLMAIAPERADDIEAMTQCEMDRGPDFKRYRRGSQLADAPQVNTDRNFIARLMFIADTIERKSWRNREKGKHGGRLGRSALTVLRVLLFVVKKHKGRLCPSYDHLARLARMSRRAVVDAVQRLKLMGFITIYRRCKRVRTELGIRVVQDNNAYEYHMPKGWGALAWSIFKPASESSNSTATAVREHNNLSDEVKPGPKPPVDLPQGAYEDGSAPPTSRKFALCPA